MEFCGTLRPMTLTMLLASVQGPISDVASSTFEANDLASFVTFTEGRYREVKRYTKALGHAVVRLRRVAFGPLRLGSLALGQCRSLTAAEVERLKSLRGP